jgi:hypothetical protein
MSVEKRNAWGWSTLAQLSMFLGSAWSGAVLSQVFLGSEHVRWCTGAVMLSPIALWVLGQWGMSGPPEKVRRSLAVQYWAAMAYVGILAGCVALAALGRVELSPEGRWKRAAAAVSVAGAAFELRRLARSRQNVSG